MDAFEKCPTFETESFILRLTEQGDSEALFECYNDKDAVSRMNDDNCDFGFFCGSKEDMANTVKYWIEAYEKRWFIRFSIVDKKTNRAVGTIEGFGGDESVMRLDIASAYEENTYLGEILAAVRKEFFALFDTKRIFTKAIPAATERVKALTDAGWKYVGKFRNYDEYYEA